MEAEKPKFKKLARHSENSYDACINNLDDGCLMLIFSFLSPIPGINFLCLIFFCLIPVLLTLYFQPNYWFFIQFFFP